MRPNWLPLVAPSSPYVLSFRKTLLESQHGVWTRICYILHTLYHLPIYYYTILGSLCLCGLFGARLLNPLNGHLVLWVSAAMWQTSDVEPGQVAGTHRQPRQYPGSLPRFLGGSKKWSPPILIVYLYSIYTIVWYCLA